MRAVAVICLLVASADAGPVFVAERAVVVGRVGDGVWTDAPTEARLDQPAELAAVAIGHRGRKRVVLAPTAITKVKLAGSTVTTEPFDDGVEAQWSLVEPHGFRTSKATNGATSEFYSNVSTEPRTFGKWLGFDKIDYFETVTRPWSRVVQIPAKIVATETDAVQLAGLGTNRYKVELRGSVVATSAGDEATDTYGILPTVHRVSIRNGDDFLGWLTSYMLVPEVFGSAGGGRLHQTERFTGADCADVMVGAIRRAGRTDLDYTNVAGLPDYAVTIAHATLVDEHGVPEHPIDGVKVGDMIRIDYGGALAHHTPRDWDHVAALWEDKSDPDGPFHGGPDGKLDGFDLVIHMGHPRLIIEPLARQAPATVDVLRWRKR